MHPKSRNCFKNFLETGLTYYQVAFNELPTKFIYIRQSPYAWTKASAKIPNSSKEKVSPRRPLSKPHLSKAALISS